MNPMISKPLICSAAVKAKEDKDDAGALMDKARGWFGKAYKINPDDPPNLYYLAQSMANRPGFPTASALNAADHALVGAPMVFEYARYYAYLNLLHGDRITAVGILTPFSADPHSHKRSQRVRAAIAGIQQNKSVEEITAILDAEDKEDETEKEKKKEKASDET
jgi:hypothetical protein